MNREGTDLLVLGRIKRGFIDESNDALSRVMEDLIGRWGPIIAEWLTLTLEVRELRSAAGIYCYSILRYWSQQPAVFLLPAPGVR
jgi:hypothetical protein